MTEILNVREFVLAALTPAMIGDKIYETVNGVKTSGFDALEPSDDEEYEDCEHGDCVVEQLGALISYNTVKNKWCSNGDFDVSGDSIGEVVTKIFEQISRESDRCHDSMHDNVEISLSNPFEHITNNIKDYYVEIAIRYVFTA